MDIYVLNRCAGKRCPLKEDGSHGQDIPHSFADYSNNWLPCALQANSVVYLHSTLSVLASEDLTLRQLNEEDCRHPFPPQCLSFGWFFLYALQSASIISLRVPSHLEILIVA
jgi:hypothetical protein